MATAPATSVMSLTMPPSRYAVHCWTALQIDPVVTATPIAKRAFFSGGSLTFRLSTQPETTMAQTKWRRRVKGVMLNGSRRFSTNPTPETSRALEVVTRVMLSHLGVVSSRR